MLFADNHKSTAAAPNQAGRALPPLPGDAALFLNFDGTLIERTSSAEDAAVPGDTLELVHSLYHQLDGALAIVTGRSLREIDDLLAPARFPGSGLHGAERRLTAGDAPERIVYSDTGSLAAALRDRLGGDGMIAVIDRQVTVTVNYGRAPERAAQCRDAMRELTLWRDDLELVEQHMAIGARPCGLNAGRVISALMCRPPFAGRTPVYVGDDTPDEEGFAAACALGGFAIKVHGGPSTANFHVDSADAVLQWLRGACRTPTGIHTSSIPPGRAPERFFPLFHQGGTT